MNYLSTLLDKAAAEGKFEYHYICAESKLTHLCFTYDLLIFTERSAQSIQGVLDVLSDFQSAQTQKPSLPLDKEAGRKWKILSFLD